MSERPAVDEVAELRLTVEDQARYIDVLLARLEYLAGEEVELRDLAATLREQVSRADADLRRLEAELTQARADVARLTGRLAAQAHSPTPQPSPPPANGGTAGQRVRRRLARAFPWLRPLYRRLMAYWPGRRG